MFYFESTTDCETVEIEKCQRYQLDWFAHGINKVRQLLYLLSLLRLLCNFTWWSTSNRSIWVYQLIHKQARQLNFNSFFFSYTVMMSYNFRNGYAILSYLEYPIILFQELILIFLVLKYKELLNIYSLFGAGMYFTITGGFLIGIVPLGLLAFLVVSYHNRIFKYNFWNALC